MAGRFTDFGEEQMLHFAVAQYNWQVRLFKSPGTDPDDETPTFTECDFTGYVEQVITWNPVTDTGSSGTYYCTSNTNHTWTHPGDGDPNVNNTIYGFTLYYNGGTEVVYYQYFDTPITMVSGVQFSFVPKLSLVGEEDVVCP